MQSSAKARRVAFTGGRNYSNGELVSKILELFPDATLLVGDATGLDNLVWQRMTVQPIEVFRADWDTHGKAAGPIRNRQMLEAGADLLIAFPGGKGTANCVKQAQQLGIPVFQVGDGDD